MIIPPSARQTSSLRRGDLWRHKPHVSIFFFNRHVTGHLGCQLTGRLPRCLYPSLPALIWSPTSLYSTPSASSRQVLHIIGLPDPALSLARLAKVTLFPLARLPKATSACSKATSIALIESPHRSSAPSFFIQRSLSVHRTSSSNTLLLSRSSIGFTVRRWPFLLRSLSP